MISSFSYANFSMNNSIVTPNLLLPHPGPQTQGFLSFGSHFPFIHLLWPPFMHPATSVALVACNVNTFVQCLLGKRIGSKGWVCRALAGKLGTKLGLSGEVTLWPDLARTWVWMALAAFWASGARL